MMKIFRHPSQSVMAAAGLAVLHQLAAAGQSQPQAAPTCFNFRNVTHYQSKSASTVQVTTPSGLFDLQLSGPGCADTKLLNGIQSAPVADVCTGPQDIIRAVTFKRDNQVPISCKVQGVIKSTNVPGPKKSKP